MGEIYDRQRIQEELQRSDQFRDVFSKIVSGKPNYKTPRIETEPITSKCTGCGTILGETQKFCHECGTKNEVQEKKK